MNEHCGFLRRDSESAETPVERLLQTDAGPKELRDGKLRLPFANPSVFRRILAGISERP